MERSRAEAMHTASKGMSQQSRNIAALLLGALRNGIWECREPAAGNSGHAAI